MISYLIKSVLCLGLFLGFYHLFLEKEKMHQFNRFYLLGSVLFSLLVPFTVIYVEPTLVESGAVQEFAVIQTEETIQEGISIKTLLMIIYGVISGILLLRFFKNIIDISLKISKNQRILIKNATLVLVNDEIVPHTFWNYIFINKEAYHQNKIEEELYTHELAHVTQKHTFDILFLEVIQIALWFNPLIIGLKRAVQLNHEFLADDTVIYSHNNIFQYQSLLLDKAAWKNKFYLASNLNYLVTKKRLLMMKKPISKRRLLVKQLAILPLLITLVFVFAERVEAQNKTNKVIIEEIDPIATPSQIKEYKNLLDAGLKSKNRNNIYKLKDIKRMQYLYGLMSKEQKKTVKNINHLIPPPPPPTPVTIEVIKEDKNSQTPPPRPQPVKIEVIKKSGKSKTPPPPPKPVLIEVKKKVKKTSKKGEEKQEKVEQLEEVIEIISKEEISEVVREAREENEHREVNEVIIEEIQEVIPEEKETVIELVEDINLKKISETVNPFEDLKLFKDKNSDFYINGKKVSKRKVMKLKSNDIKTMHVKKKAGKNHIEFITN